MMRYNQYYQQAILISSLILFLILTGCRSRAPSIEPTATLPLKATTNDEIQPLESDARPKQQTRRASPDVWASPEEHPGLPDTAMEVDLYAVSAPEFPPDLEWLNIDEPLLLADLRGKVVVLIFWTYQCIDCVYSFQDLKRLQQAYPDELAIIGIHSLKLTTEAETDNVRQAILYYELDYPIINDRDLRLWSKWGIQSTPALVIIDPVGTIFGFDTGGPGQDVYKVFKPIIQLLVPTDKER